LNRGVFASYTGTRSVRLRPHLITTPAEVERALAVFHAVAEEMGA
jgi:4-aminobutyrate aminotransferase/(S)-3-amino-2-methylpropionate transaminase